jgi:hypothetical protein
VTVIDDILAKRIRKDENLTIPFLEKLFERMLGF